MMIQKTNIWDWVGLVMVCITGISAYLGYVNITAGALIGAFLCVIGKEFTK